MNEKKIKKNTIYSIIKSCSTIIFPLITFPYISRVLLTENIGKINFSTSVVSYFSLIATLGISTYAIRECSRIKNDKDKLERTIGEILSINVCTMLVSYVILFIVLIVFKKLENHRNLIIIQSSAILFTTFGADWINITMEDFRYITLRNVSFQILSLILMFIFVKSPNDYIKYVIITIISSSGGNIINIIYRQKYCKTKLYLKMNIKKHLPPILTLFAMNLAQQIFVNSDTTILGLIKGDYEVGLYSTSVKIYNVVSTLMSSISWVVIPKLSSSFEKKEFDEVSNILKYAIGFTATIGIPIVIGMCILSSNIIELIAGNEYIGATISLQILSIALLFSLAWGVVMNMILLPDKKDKECLKACSISAILNVLLNLIFIPKYGLNAAAMTTTLSQLIGLLICCKYVNNNISINIQKNFWISISLGSILIILFVLSCKLFITNNLLVLVVSTIGSVLIYSILQIIFNNYWVKDIISEIKNKKRRILREIE